MAKSEAPSIRGPYLKTETRRAEIIDAAIRVFAARGYHGGSLREISRDIGMSLSAVTYHFANKEALLEGVLKETDRQGEDYDRSQGLVAWVLGLSRQNLARKELLRMLAIVSAEASSPAHPAHTWSVVRYANIRTMIREMVVLDQKAGRISADRDPEFLANAIIALWDGLQLQWLIDPASDMVETMKKALDAIIPEARLDQ